MAEIKLPKIQVENMCGRTGREVANQFIITTSDSVYFQSYATIIACDTCGQIYLDKQSWDCSTTTGKYRNKFLRETKKETKAKIKLGEYILTDLN